MIPYFFISLTGCDLTIGNDSQDSSSKFISKWTTTDSYRDVTLPLNSSGTFNFIVDWGDGNTDEVTSYDDPDATHTYESTGTFTVTITGTIDGFGFDNHSFISNDNSISNYRLTDITQWGNVKLHNHGYQFYFCTNLTDFSATDNLDTSEITNMNSMFYRDNLFNGDIGDWDVSKVTNMGQMFESASSFNKDISDWTVSVVTSMYGMFSYASAFNQDISGWTVSSVTNMSGMFRHATSFNQNLSSWNVSNVTHFDSFNDSWGGQDEYIPNFSDN